ncbi:MAG: hypothetical protein E6H10_10040 [Bacteroidetes bacterium]|nr:MAG: hypothetical protein E6H10_10040 [Bacteroidota bacterium]
MIYFTGSIPAVTTFVTGGTAGLEYGGDPACNAAIPPANGSNGSTVSTYTIRQSTDSASYCLSIAPLAVKLFYFRLAQQTSDIQLQWSISNPELAKQFVPEKIISNNWSPLSIIQADGLKKTYSYIDEHPGPRPNLYRLKVI